MKDASTATREACEGITESDGPTSAIRIAFDVAPDRKAVIQLAVDAARSLRPKVSLLDILKPFPGPLEAIERWTGDPYHHSADQRLITRLKAGAIAFVATAAGTSTWKLVSESSSPIRGATAWLVIGAILLVLCLTTVLVTLWLNLLVARQAARLEELSALNGVLRIISTWGRRNATKLPDVQARLKRKLCELLAPQPQLGAAQQPLSRPTTAPPPRAWPEYDAFRTDHATVDEAIASCPRPDWLVHLGLEALPNDHKNVIQLASSAAWSLQANNRTAMMRLITPYPSRLEVIDAYCGNTQLIGDHRSPRAAILALLPASVFTYVGDSYVWGASVGAFRYQLATLVMLASQLVITLLIRRIIALVVRIQGARLDHNEALRIVLHDINTGMTNAPQRVPTVADAFRRHLRTIIEASSRDNR